MISTPLIMFVGEVERGFREREAFSELDYRATFGSMTKWVTEIDQPDRVTEFVLGILCGVRRTTGSRRYWFAGRHVERACRRQ